MATVWVKVLPPGAAVGRELVGINTSTGEGPLHYSHAHATSQVRTRTLKAHKPDMQICARRAVSMRPPPLPELRASCRALACVVAVFFCSPRAASLEVVKNPSRRL